MFDTRYQMGISPSSGTASTGYDLSEHELHVDISFISFASPIRSGGPDVIGEESPSAQHKRRIRESLDKSIQENAEVWQELSKR